MSAEVWYVDSSAIVKTVIEEPESERLGVWLDRRPPLATCELARVEVVRAVRVADPDALPRTREALRTLTFIRLQSEIYDAANLEPPTLRSLDALHLAAALSLGDDLAGLVTYDARLADGARALGVAVEAPR